jgi:hypothetical protein
MPANESARSQSVARNTPASPPAPIIHAGPPGAAVRPAAWGNAARQAMPNAQVRSNPKSSPMLDMADY